MTDAKLTPCSQDRGRVPVPAPPARAGGFTLIELIIALALVSLITVLLFSGLRLGSRAWDGVDTVSERNAELRSARGFLDRALTQARDLVLRLDAEDRQVFAGNGTNLEFVAPLSEHVGVPGLYVLRLGLEGRGADGRLVLTRWLLHPDVMAGNAEAPEWRPLDPDSPGISGDPAEERDLSAGAFGQTVLLEGVGDFQLTYFGIAEETDLDQSAAGSPVERSRFSQAGRDEEEPEGKWYEEWTNQPHPPQLIRVRLTSRRQDWPDSVIRLPQVDQAHVDVPQVVEDPEELPQGGAQPTPAPPRGNAARRGAPGG